MSNGEKDAAMDRAGELPMERRAGERRAKPVVAVLPANKMQEALQKIARWELPIPDSRWDDGTPMSYGAAFGSNGERDYMRQVALDALAATPALPAEEVQPFGFVRQDEIDNIHGMVMTKLPSEGWTVPLFLAASASPAPALPVVPEGFVLMPKRPSEGVLQPDGFPRLDHDRYQAMLAAAQNKDDVSAYRAAVPDLPVQQQGEKPQDDLGLAIRHPAEPSGQHGSEFGVWFSMADRMPPLGVSVLIFYPQAVAEPYRIDMWDEMHEDPIGMGGATICTGEDWLSYGDDEITYWTPLPPVPSEPSNTAGSACQGGNTSDELPISVSTYGSVEEREKEAARRASNFTATQAAQLTEQGDDLMYQVLRNELAIIIGCADGRSAQEKAAAVIGWFDKHDRRAIESALTIQGGEDARDAARYQWLKERFTGYDFYWGGKPDAESEEDQGKCVIVFECGQDFRGGRDFESAIDAAILAAQSQKGGD